MKSICTQLIDIIKKNLINIKKLKDTFYKKKDGSHVSEGDLLIQKLLQDEISKNYSKYFFNGHIMDFWKYIDCGFVIVNKNHRDFFKQVIDFYNQNAENIRSVERTWHAGTDQTPVNFLIHEHNVDFKLLPYEYNMCDLFRKEVLHDDLLFTKLGWIYQYNGIPNNKEDSLTYHWMKKTYEYLYD